MAVQIILKNSSIEDKRPTANQLANGEVSLNYNDAGAFLCCRDTDGNIQQIGGIKISDDAPGSPVRGTLWYQQITGTLFVHNGTNWLSVAGGGGGGGGGGDVSQIIGADGIDVAPAAGTGVVTLNADIDIERGLEFVAGSIAVNLGAGLEFNTTTGAIDNTATALQYQGTVDLTSDVVPADPNLGDTFANTGDGVFSDEWVTATGEADGTDADPGDLVVWNGTVFTFIPTGSPGGGGAGDLGYTPTTGTTAGRGGTVTNTAGNDADIPMAGHTDAGVLSGAAQAGLMSPTDKELIDSLPIDANGNFEQAQSDWDEDDVDSPAHILNRPTIDVDVDGNITNVSVDLAYEPGDTIADGGTITNTAGDDAEIPFATAANAGLFIEAGTPPVGEAQYVRQVADDGTATWEELRAGEVPSGGTDDRPDQPTIGDLYFDTDLNVLLYWDGTEWVPVQGGDAIWQRDAQNEVISPANQDDNVGIGGELQVVGDVQTGRDLVIQTPGRGLFIAGSEDADTQHLVEIVGPNENPDFTDNYRLTLPPNDGDANQFLQTDGNGVLSWAAGGGGGGGDFLPLAGGNLTGGVTQTERDISDGFDLSDGNFWNCDVTTVPVTTNGVNGQSGLIRFSTVPTAWADNHYSNVPQNLEAGDIVPFYVLSPTSIALGVRNLTGAAPEYAGPSAWGSVASDGTLIGGLNCTVARTAAGAYTITFNNAMPNANYSVVAETMNTGRFAGVGTSKTATEFNINTRDTSGNQLDLAFDFVVHASNATPPRGGTGADAWASCSGRADDGPANVRASFNIQSVTRNTAGRYDVVFTNPMPTADYAVIVTGSTVGNQAQVNATTNVKERTGFEIDLINIITNTDGDYAFDFVVHATNAQLPDTVTQEQLDAVLNNWTRTGTTLSPTNAGDTVEIDGFTYANRFLVAKDGDSSDIAFQAWNDGGVQSSVLINADGNARFTNTIASDRALGSDVCFSARLNAAQNAVIYANGNIDGNVVRSTSLISDLTPEQQTTYGLQELDIKERILNFITRIEQLEARVAELEGGN